VASVSPSVLDPTRIAAVRASGLLDTGPEEAFDRLTALALRLIGAPVAFITLVDADRSFWKSAAGVASAGPREDRLERSFSRHVLAADRTVMVADTAAPGAPGPVPDIDGSPVGAWMGAPVRDSDDLALGAFMVADPRPRDWSPQEISALEALAGTAGGEIELRRSLRETRDALLALDRLQQASAALLGALSHDEIADVALAEAVAVLGARAVSIGILDEGGTKFVARRSLGFPDSLRGYLDRLDLRDSLLSAEAARTRRPVWAAGEAWRRAFPDSAAIAGSMGTEAAALPLAAGDRLLGILGLVFDAPRPRTAMERMMASALASHCAQAMERGRLYDREHRTAEVLQRSLLPGRLPAVPELEIAARYIPSGAGSRVGGDFFDLFPVAVDEWCAVVGDVCGKGPEAAAVTAQARHVVRAHARIGLGPAGVLSRLNEALIEDGRSFLTAVCMRFRADAESVEGRLALGGHPPPLVARAAGAVESVGTPGTLVGVLERMRLREVHFTLDPGDAMVLYTDGVTEARRRGEQFGGAGLAAVLHDSRGLDADAIATRIERAVRAHAGAEVTDDVALLVLRRLK
jgi:serine phosphatase RsbU (regulator of sigma subunit)